MQCSPPELIAENINLRIHVGVGRKIFAEKRLEACGGDGAKLELLDVRLNKTQKGVRSDFALEEI